MKGSYAITVSNAKLRYDFTIRRNITIIKGNSATGKTTLVEMIREYYESGEDSGIHLKCEKSCRVLGGRDWKALLSLMDETIVFIDEENAFLPTKEFAEAVRGSDNYYVIVTREGLPNLPYSVEEIYGIRESGKYASLKQTYNELFHIYGKTDYTKPVKPEYVIVEDSNSGYEFFTGAVEKGRCKVVSAGGKSNLFVETIKSSADNMLIIADGAAFGSEMDRMMKQIQRKKGMVLYLPESFEWLILQSGIISDGMVNAVLEKPENFINSQEYFSWERFFTALLIQMTKDTYLKYSKKKLNEVYLQEEIASKIIQQMTGIEL
ncbi:translation initiation factor 2 [Lachnospiraceae bacterium]|nr:translation initiation factor 2 [Lachnospiraceae bacterium]